MITKLPPAPVAAPSDVTDARDVILAALASAAASGEVRNFQKNLVPVGWTPLAGSDYTMSGGVATQLQQVAQASMGGAACVVTMGTGAGLWVTNGAAMGLQRYSLDTGLAVGPAYACPVTAAAASPISMVAIGKLIYIAGYRTASANAAHYRFDTETGAYTAIASFPQTITMASTACSVRGQLLSDGRILYVPGSVNGATQHGNSVKVFLYNPTTNATPASVTLTLTFSQASQSSGVPASVLALPGGHAVWIDNPTATSATRQSHRLTISGDSITVETVESCGVTAAYGAGLLETDTGVIGIFGSTWRSYTAAGGWVGASNPIALGGWSALVSARVPGLGWLTANSSYAIFTPYLLLTGSLTAIGSTVVAARKD